MIKESLPIYCSGTVIKGFGRGSKQLGIPTANYSNDVVESLPSDASTGVYYGWAQVDSGEVNKMVMSVGWNPYYKNKTKSMEAYIMQKFEEDFYGANLKTCILGYIRPEKDFSSLDELVAAIKSDIALANELLDNSEYIRYKTDPFFQPTTVNGTTNGHSKSCEGDIPRNICPTSNNSSNDGKTIV